MALKGYKAKQENKVSKVTLALKEHRVSKEFKVYQESKESRVYRDLRESRVFQVLQVTMAMMVKLAKMVQMDFCRMEQRLVIPLFGMVPNGSLTTIIYLMLVEMSVLVWFPMHALR